MASTRELELMAEGYDHHEATEIALDEEGAERFYDELDEAYDEAEREDRTRWPKR